MLDNVRFVRFEGLEVSRSISSDVLSTKPEDERAVRLGVDNHTSRIYNILLAVVLYYA